MPIENEEIKKETERKFSELAFCLGQIMGILSIGLRDEDLIAEFAARRVNKVHLFELKEAVEKVAVAFYNEPEPI